MALLALITGASSGIGAEFARQLAAEGHDLVLTARRADRLGELAATLQDRYGVAVRTVVADLAVPGAAARVAGQAGPAVDLLVSNAGFGLFGDFVHGDRARVAEMVQLNAGAAVELAHLLLPGMLARGRGGLIIVASAAAFQPTPYLAVYGATKAFLLHFAEALHEEVRGRGVRVTALCPGPVATEFQEVSGLPAAGPYAAMAAAPVVRAGLAGWRRGAPSVVPGPANYALANLTRLAPRWAVARLGALVLGSLRRGRAG